MVKSVSTIRDLRLVLETWRRRDETVGFVSTLGALHEGHKPLLQQAQNLATRVVVSIFTHPSLFRTQANYEAHPVTPDEDDAFLTRSGCDLLFKPSLETMFSSEHGTSIDPGQMGKVLGGMNSPDYFTNFATIATKLLLQVMPDFACYGENNYQHYRIVDQIVQDLHIPVGIIPVSTLRDEDGIPYTRRSMRLTGEERRKASCFSKILEDAAQMIRDEKNVDATLNEARTQMEIDGLAVDYLSLVNARNLVPVNDVRKACRLMAAVHIGNLRATDNWAI